MSEPIDEAALSAEAMRLLAEGLYTGRFTLKSGIAYSVDSDEGEAIMRMAIDLSRRVQRRRKMSINPDDLRPKRTAKKEEPSGPAQAGQAPQA